MQQAMTTYFSENHEAFIREIADSNGSGYYNQPRLKVGVITDNFTYETFFGALDLEYLSKDTYASQIDNGEFAFVLYISCWFGMNDSNEYRGRDGIDAAIAILNYAKSKDIVTVFYTIEDTSNYHVFLDVAKIADFIFTSAEEMIPNYRRDTGNSKICVLEYGINPSIHNPIGLLYKRKLKQSPLKDTVLFAGSWMARYTKRQESIQMLFDGVIDTEKYGMLVLNRNYYRDSPNFKFPEKYDPYIVPVIEYKKLQKVSKLFDFSLNLNSITDSATMCAMRTYEMQALGVLLISNYALALSRNFPGIFTPFFSEEVKHILDGYTENEIISMQLEGIRDVYSGRTVYDRLNYVFSHCGIDYCFEEKTVYVLCNKPTERIVRSFEAQTYQAKELLNLEEIKLCDLPGDGFCIYLDDEDYDCHFIEDLINAHKFVNVGYVCFGSWDNLKDTYVYTTETAINRNTLFNLNHVNSKDIVNNSLPDDLVGFKILAPKYGRDTASSEKELAVIMPVFNNGKYLKGRSFRSLLRSSIFEKMHVYLIDDGSTDGKTLQIVKEIADVYDNVDVYHFPPGGSGSASRARNKGIELACEPLVTFLDPDNEAIGDGYARLLEIIDKDKTLNFVMGGTYKVNADATSGMGLTPRSGYIDNSQEYLKERKFMPLNCQTMIIKRDHLIDNDIRFVEGGLGEDTLFFQEVCGVGLSKAYGIELPIILKYDDRKKTIEWK